MDQLLKEKKKEILVILISFKHNYIVYKKYGQRQ